MKAREWQNKMTLVVDSQWNIRPLEDVPEESVVRLK